MSISLRQPLSKRPLPLPNRFRRPVACVVGMMAIVLVVTAIAIYTHARPSPAELPRPDSAVLSRRLFSLAMLMLAQIMLVGLVLPTLWSRRAIHVAISAGLGLLTLLLLIASLALALA